jgi:hypothetical protein
LCKWIYVMELSTWTEFSGIQKDDFNMIGRIWKLPPSGGSPGTGGNFPDSDMRHWYSNNCIQFCLCLAVGSRISISQSLCPNCYQPATNCWILPINHKWHHVEVCWTAHLDDCQIDDETFQMSNGKFKFKIELFASDSNTKCGRLFFFETFTVREQLALTRFRIPWTGRWPGFAHQYES